MPSTDPHAGLLTLTAAGTVVEVAPRAGGRVAQIRAEGEPLLVDVPEDAGRPMQWGSFPMAPWAGRIREGRFTFAGVRHQLVTNHHDGGHGHGAAPDPRRTHSIHGTVFTRPWSVDELTPTAAVMSCPLEGALDWPFAGVATQRIEASPQSVHCELTVTSSGDRFPAVVGWHPWFRKPDRLLFRPTAMYVRDEFGIPTGEIVEPRPGPWDDCFVNTEPVVLLHDRAVAAEVTVSSDCDHWVVFDHMHHATCVEPQSGPPDAFGLGERAVGGLVTVDPSTPLHRTMTVSW